MVTSAERNLIAEVRRDTGATNSDRVPTDVLENDLKQSKVEISKEIKNKLDNGEVLNFEDGASKKALKNHFRLRASVRVKGPQQTGLSIPSLRRTRFDDTEIEYWRDQLLKNIGKI